MGTESLEPGDWSSCTSFRTIHSNRHNVLFTSQDFSTEPWTKRYRHWGNSNDKEDGSSDNWNSRNSNKNKNNNDCWLTKIQYRRVDIYYPRYFRINWSFAQDSNNFIILNLALHASLACGRVSSTEVEKMVENCSGSWPTPTPLPALADTKTSSVGQVSMVWSSGTELVMPKHFVGLCMQSWRGETHFRVKLHPS